MIKVKNLQINQKDAFVLENAPLGIKSAKAAGLRCIALETSLSQEYLQDADYVYLSFEKMNQHLLFTCLEK